MVVNAWSVYRLAVIVTAILVLYTAFRPHFAPIALIAGLAILALAFVRRPRPRSGR
jgi:Na+-translocating ferredoxin:NAD+ oxidoreductase RnfD subunit